MTCWDKGKMASWSLNQIEYLSHIVPQGGHSLENQGNVSGKNLMKKSGNSGKSQEIFQENVHPIPHEVYFNMHTTKKTSPINFGSRDIRPHYSNITQPSRVWEKIRTIRCMSNLLVEFIKMSLVYLTSKQRHKRLLSVYHIIQFPIE